MTDTPIDPKREAKRAKLHYVHDTRPGIARRATKGGFAYTAPDGAKVTDEETLARIAKLAIPPAYTDVWICTDPDGHLQATGRDARGRKQYRYHARWRAVRDESKYGRTLAFAEALPAIRARVDADLQRQGVPRAKVLALIVKLLETTLIRVGNDEYARDNKSYGLTTLRNRHLTVEGAKLHFDFRAKSGIHRELDVTDRRLARIVKTIRDLPGQSLFQYVDKDGTRHGIDSQDVNDYLHEAAGAEFTAKDFRTWAGTVLAALALAEVAALDADAASKSQVLRAVERVAERLGNTPSVCRKCYIHPEIFAAHLDGTLAASLEQIAAQALADEGGDMSKAETAVLALLRGRLAREAKAA